MPKMNVQKSSGEIVPYDEDKVRKSLERSGADRETVQEVLDVVEKNLRKNIPTHEIYTIARRELKKRMPWAAARYNLREAIVRFGPAGFNFEKYVASVLTAYGYETETPGSFKGACIEHETDVVAKKSGRTVFIEAKFRHDFKTHIDIKDTMSTWARFLDLVDGAKLDLCPHFDEAWIVTNARFSDHSLKYGHCKNMKLIGWNHPKERTFANMVDVNALYPITVMDEMSDHELDLFSNADIMLCREVEEQEIETLKEATGIKPSRLKELKRLCTGIVEGETVKTN